MSIRHRPSHRPHRTTVAAPTERDRAQQNDDRDAGITDPTVSSHQDRPARAPLVPWRGARGPVRCRGPSAHQLVWAPSGLRRWSTSHVGSVVPGVSRHSSHAWLGIAVHTWTIAAVQIGPSGLRGRRST